MDNLGSESAEAQIDGLDFSLPTTSMAITSRRFINVFPSGSNVYNSTSGNKVIRFNISADDNQFLDLSSVRMFAILENKDGTADRYLRPIGGLHSFFSRYTCNEGGQQVQDIIEYNRHCELYDCFKSKDVRDMDDIENGANPRWDSDYHQMATGLENIINPTVGGTLGEANNAARATVTLTGDRNDFGRIDKRYTRHSLSGIKPNGKMRLSHKPCCGLLGSNYLLPLRYAPLQLEFTIVQNGNDPIVVPQGEEATNDQQSDRNGWYFQEGNTSTQWEINSVIIRAEMVQLDNTIANNFASHLLTNSGSLKMVFPMYHTITQSFSAGGGEITMQIVKSASKLTGAFITLYRPPRQGLDPITNYYHPDNYAYKRWNYFYNPMINSRVNTLGADTGEGFQDYTRNLSWQIQLSNAQKYPEFESQSLSETFYYLRRALHYMYPDQDSLSFGYRQYRENKFIIGMSFEKMPDVNFTGYNSKMSGVTTFKIKGTEGALAANEQIEEIFTHLISEAVLEIRESGAVVYD